VIVLDTSVLIDALSGPRRSAAAMRDVLAAGERMLLPALVLSEWLRGPRLPEELAAQDALLPAEAALPFGPAEASAATDLYRSVPEPRGREVDIAIAAHAIVRDVPVWTLNVADFEDLPGVGLFAA
jgi:predicted nucleic acid-binding protein